jgi:hypothetical protein
MLFKGGDYNLQVTGIKGSLMCGSVNEVGTLNLTCPSPSSISLIKFASFGTPSDGQSCGEAQLGGMLRAIVSRYCN